LNQPINHVKQNSTIFLAGLLILWRCTSNGAKSEEETFGIYNVVRRLLSEGLDEKLPTNKRREFSAVRGPTEIERIRLLELKYFLRLKKSNLAALNKRDPETRLFASCMAVHGRAWPCMVLQTPSVYRTRFTYTRWPYFIIFLNYFTASK
jgi:hypothetical protein